MDKHIAQAISQTGGFYYYGLYGIERIGVASGRKYFGTIDWYQTRRRNKFLKGQAANGGYGSIHDTCFALIFLVRGRAPVMMNKLMYENATKKQTDPWNGARATAPILPAGWATILSRAFSIGRLST